MNACMTSPQLEAGAQEIIDMGFCERLKLTLREVWRGFKIRPLYRLVLFYLVFCGLVPSFSSYFYYYLTNDLSFSAMQYAMLSVVGSLALLVVIYLYNLWFQESESRTMLAVCCLISAYGSLNVVFLIRGHTYGMEPTAFVFLTTTLTDTLGSAIRLLSGNVLFAKLIPANIEASMFSILTGIVNFCNHFVAQELGNLLNLFVGVTEDNLEKLWVLELIATGAALIPIVFIKLVPTRREVFHVLQVNQFEEKFPKGSNDSLDALREALLKLDAETARRMGIFEKYSEELGSDFVPPSIAEDSPSSSSEKETPDVGQR